MVPMLEETFTLAPMSGSPLRASVIVPSMTEDCAAVVKASKQKKREKRMLVFIFITNKMFVRVNGRRRQSFHPHLSNVKYKLSVKVLTQIRQNFSFLITLLTNILYWERIK
jgi:hypothetical protein